MISIIVCSISLDVFENFSRNIGETIGVPYELIRIDNSDNKHSICSAYNKGASMARFECLCFAHEDICVKTPAWGKKVIEIFESNRQIGLIGIAGSSYRTVTPSSWGAYPDSNYINIVQHFKHQKKAAEHWYVNPGNELLARVVCVDGAWFCTKSEIVASVPFDNDTFKGFHCYDIDFSLSVLQTHEVAVTFEILIEHFSEGGYSKTWVEETFKLHEKWKEKLPVNLLAGLRPRDQRLKEKEAILRFFNVLRRLGYSPFAMQRVIQTTNNRIKLGVDIEISLSYRLFREYVKYVIGYRKRGKNKKAMNG